MNQEANQRPLGALSEGDVLRVMNALPAGVSVTLLVFPQLFIAGGFIRAVLAGEQPKDVDIFTTDLEVVERAVCFYHQQEAGWRGRELKEASTPCTITVTGDDYPIQFINNIACDSPRHCIDQFDFTVCQAAIWRRGGAWDSCCAPEFTRDVADRRLVYTSPVRKEAPGGSLWRAIKFCRRGYSITQAELAKLVARCVNGQEKIQCESRSPDEESDEVSPDQIHRSFSMRGGRGWGWSY